MKKSMLLHCLLFVSTSLLANVAQPGLWQAGGTGSFSLLFEEDQDAYKKIQMQKERVSIQLYKGYAVVKGKYWMFNHSDEFIKMKAGYPINASFEPRKNAPVLTQILFDEMYHLEVKSDGNKVDYTKLDLENEIDNITHFDYDQSLWYVWENKFKPNDLTKIEVCFILNTNNASVSEGYDNEAYNGFIYVLETGATWKPSIDNGEIFIQFMDGLTKKSVTGVSGTFNYDYSSPDKILYTSFSNLTPTHEDNIVVTYHERIPEFNFEKIMDNKTALFQSIDQLSNIQTNNLKKEAVSFDSPFDISNIGSMVIGGVFFFALYGIPILLGLIFLFIMYRIVKRFIR